MGLLADTLRRIEAHRRPSAPPPRRDERRADVASPRAAPPPALPTNTTPSTRSIPRLGEEGRYVFGERVGIGLDLGMELEDAEDVALREALLADAPPHLREAVGRAIDVIGAWEVEEVRVIKTEEVKVGGVTLADAPLAVGRANYPSAMGGGGSGKETKEATT